MEKSPKIIKEEGSSQMNAEQRNIIRSSIEKMYDSLATGSKMPHFLNIIFIKQVKDNITKLVPRAEEVFREVDEAFRSLPKKDGSDQRTILIDIGTEITAKILSEHLTTEELNHKLKEN